jgi:replicative DNA helicase
MSNTSAGTDAGDLQRSILGCLLAFPEERHTVEAQLQERDFLGEKYRTVYRYLLDNPDADLVIASTALAGTVTPVELSEWMGGEFLPNFLPGYCRQLKELARKARLYNALSEVRNQADVLTADELYDLAERTLLELATASTQEIRDVKTLALKALDRLELRYKNRGKVLGLDWGYRGLNSLTGGAHRGDMIVIAGRPSMGKSAFAMNVIENMAGKGSKALVFSLEMSAEQVMDRMIASHSRVGLSRIRNGEFADSDWQAMTTGVGKIGRCNIGIDDSPALTLGELKSRARQYKLQHGLDVVMVDYMTLMKTESRKNESRTREVGELSRGLKQLARELNVPVIVLCQLNRGVMNRKDTRPVMSDLRDSGEIEQDADVILFPYREAAECQLCRDGVENHEHSTKSHQMRAEIIIEKQRNGPRNVSLPFVWLGDYQRFEEVVGD